jgi:hypothetical protein
VEFQTHEQFESIALLIILQTSCEFKKRNDYDDFLRADLFKSKADLFVIVSRG